MRPTDIGYHCNGECWSKLGGDRGLVQSLGEQSEAKRDWFVRALWATSDNVNDWPIPPLDLIHPVQDYLEESALGVPAVRQYFDRYPTLFIWNEKTFVFQGTHRLAHYTRSGIHTYRGWQLNLDR